MAATVFSFAPRVLEQRGWTNEELAELYRVEHALAQARIVVETDHGVTDEGDPWFVFCRPGGEVIVHATRFNGLYRLYSPALPQPLTGVSFAALTKSFVSGLRAPVQTDANVSIHPAALLSVLIAAIFYSIDFHSGLAQAAEVIDVQQKKAADASHVLSQPVSTETLFHTFVATINGLLDSAAGAVSHPLAFLATVEAAAIAALAVAISGLADFGTGSNSELVSKTAVDDQQNGVLLHQQLADKGSVESIGDATIARAAIASSHNDPLGQDANLILLVAGDENGLVVAAGEKAATQNLNANQAAIADGQASANTAEKTTAVLLAGVDGSGVAADTRGELAVSASHSNDGAAAGVIALANEDTAALLGSENSQAASIVLVSGSGNVDLSNSAGVDKITVSGIGDIYISGITSAENPQLVLGSGSVENLSLSFATNATPSFSIQLNGHDQLWLTSLSTNGANLHLTIDSEGSVANTVTITDAAVVNAPVLTLTVIGVQDLTLNETAALFTKTSVNTTGLTGALTVSLDIGNVFKSVDLSQVNAANYIVADNANIAFLHAADGSNIQLGSNLNIVDFTIAATNSSTPLSLGINLQPLSGQAGGVAINLLDVFFTPNLTINSAGAASGINTIEALSDSSLSTLTLTGDSALVVKSIGDLTASDAQDITIDAHALTGSLTLNASSIADTASLGRSVTIIAGSGNSVLTNTTISESTSFVAGAGSDVINIGGGAIKDSIVNLAAADSVNIGNAVHNDVVVSALNAGSEQGVIESQSSVTAAAQLASAFAGSSAGQQAVLFSYHGDQYVFIDASGNHLFDANYDAIIKLVGLVAGTNLANVFHSA